MVFAVRFGVTRDEPLKQIDIRIGYAERSPNGLPAVERCHQFYSATGGAFARL